MTETLVYGITCVCSTAFCAEGDVGEQLRQLGATGTATYHPPMTEAAVPHALAAGWQRLDDGRWVCPLHAPATATAPPAGPLKRP